MLVLDDFHLITAPAVLDSVGLLLRRLPPGLRLALVTRTDPPLPLARLRAGGQLAELRSADLRFTLEETAAFLAEIAGADVPARPWRSCTSEPRAGRLVCSSQRSRFGETRTPPASWRPSAEAIAT